VGGDSQLAKGYRSAQVISVCARKGGVGKTTTAINLAAGAALFHNLKVLLVDMDAQSHCRSALHRELRALSPDTLSNVLLNKQMDVQHIATPTEIDGLFIATADKSLASTEGVMTGRIGKEFLLRNALKIARTHYDLIIVDCPPTLGTLTLNALIASDWILIPCDMSVLSLEGVDDIHETIETLEDTLGHALRVLGIVKTRVDARNQKVNNAIDTSLRGRYGRSLLANHIPKNTKISQAQMEGTPIFNFDPRCAGSVAYRALLEEIGCRLRLF
jgi:chromosome partitioning protein